jgi:hypothetical protein
VIARSNHVLGPRPGRTPRLALGNAFCLAFRLANGAALLIPAIDER